MELKTIGRILSDKQTCLKLKRWSKRVVYIAILLTVIGFLGTVQGYAGCSDSSTCGEQLIFVMTFEGSLTLGALFLIVGIVFIILGIIGYILFHMKSK